VLEFCSIFIPALIIITSKNQYHANQQKRFFENNGICHSMCMHRAGRP
jgi:hypothetical protein